MLIIQVVTQAGETSTEVFHWSFYDSHSHHGSEAIGITELFPNLSYAILTGESLSNGKVKRANPWVGSFVVSDYFHRNIESVYLLTVERIIQESGSTVK